MKERRGFGGEAIMVQMVNLRALMMCKPAQASAVDVSEAGFLIPATECCLPHLPNRIRKPR
jgi:hypothetical protein